MQTTVTKHWFIVVSYLVLYLHWLSCFSGASEVKSLLSPNVSSKAIVPKTAYSKQVFLDKRCPFLFLEFLDGSIELLHAIQGTPLWSIRSEKVFLANKEEQPSVLDHCILG